MNTKEVNLMVEKNRTSEQVDLKELVLESLEDIKAVDVVCIDVRDKTEMTDYMIVVSGTSNRHVKSIANNVIVDAKEAGFMPLGIEGLNEGEWVLVDLVDVVVHMMLPSAREFYDIERLWNMSVQSRAAGSTQADADSTQTDAD
ncbi:MAG: ribosome-associated protein [Candidatus Azotimanducaceae bacterium]|jgi:ribosome-associated protein